MQYLFDESAGAAELTMRGDAYKYLIKVRRHQVGDKILLRHPEQPELLHRYLLESVDGRRAHLTLERSEEEPVKAEHSLHIGWCVIDPKSVEKVLPTLNELGVAKITFIYCERSQKSFRPDFKRFERMLESSMQQCGRSEWMELEMMDSLDDFLSAYPGAVVLDFCNSVLKSNVKVATVLIGAEGGFSEEERTRLSRQRCIRFDTPMILRSESAATAIAAKML